MRDENKNDLKQIVQYQDGKNRERQIHTQNTGEFFSLVLKEKNKNGTGGKINMEYVKSVRHTVQ